MVRGVTDRRKMGDLASSAEERRLLSPSTMWRRTALVALALASTGSVAASIAACRAQTSHEGEGETNFCSTAAQSCAPAVDVESARQVVDAIVAVKESRDSLRTHGGALATIGSTGADLAPTGDLHATMDIEIPIADYPELEPCPSCVERTPFIWAVIDGITCVEEADGGPGSGCLRIRIASGTIFRAKRAFTPTGMIAPRYAHSVRLLDSCTTPCTAGWCAASATCMPMSELCLLCDGKSLAACACQNDCVAAEEGSRCEVNTSEDTFSDGTCSGGECR